MCVCVCVCITCHLLSSQNNGTISYNTRANNASILAFGVMAAYSCDTGFSLVGNNTRTCTGDGSSTTGVLDGEAPTCDGE